MVPLCTAAAVAGRGSAHLAEHTCHNSGYLTAASSRPTSAADYHRETSSILQQAPCRLTHTRLMVPSHLVTLIGFIFLTCSALGYLVTPQLRLCNSRQCWYVIPASGGISGSGCRLWRPALCVRAPPY